MKLKIASIAAAVALSVSIAGAAGSANAAGLNAGPAINKSVLDNNVQQISYYGYGYNLRRCARLRHLARMGSRWARVQYLRHCRFGYGNGYGSYKCRILYRKGFVFGNPVARHLYRKYCRFYRVGYGY